jgi:hypothetical protein
VSTHPTYVVEMQPVSAAEMEPWTELSLWVYRDLAMKAMTAYAKGEPAAYGPDGYSRLRVREVSR